MNVFNLGNWGIATCYIQQGSLEGNWGVTTYRVQQGSLEGNWGVATCRIQQGSLEAAAFSMFSKIGVSKKVWGRSDMEAIARFGRYNKLSQYQKCGLNICCCARKLIIDRRNGRVFIPQLGSQAYILATASHGLRYGGWSCHEYQSGPCAACVFQYCDKRSKSW